LIHKSASIVDPIDDAGDENDDEIDDEMFVVLGLLMLVFIFRLKVMISRICTRMCLFSVY